MPRPRKIKFVESLPVTVFYKPHGVPANRLQGVNLPVEGLEALRLSDALGLGQMEAAERMGVSTATFCRVLSQARQLVAQALSQGWAIHIDGGDYQVAPAESRERGWRNGRGRGRGGRRGRGRM